MNNEERKYADLGKFENLFEILEQEINKNMQRTSRNKDSAYDYIMRDLRRMDDNLPRSRSCANFLKEVQRLVRDSRRDAKERDEMFSRGIMEKLKEELQTAVPNGDYESVDANKFMEIAQQLLATIEKELKEKEKAEVSYGVRSPNGHFKKLQNEFEQKARRMLTLEEREEVAGYVRRMRGGAEELEMVEKQGGEVAIANVTRIFDEFIGQQRSMEQMADMQTPFSSYETQNNQMSPEIEEALANAPNPFSIDYEAPNNQMSQETKEVLKNAPSPQLDGSGLDKLAEDAFKDAPMVNLDDETMESIAPQSVIDNEAKETMESIAPKVVENRDKDNESYEVLRQPQYDADGKLIVRGSAKTRSVGNMEDLAQGERYVTIHNKDFDLTCTVEEAIKMLENDRTVAKDRAKKTIGEMFL